MKIILLLILAYTSTVSARTLSFADYNSLTAIKTTALGEQITIADVDFDHIGTVSLNLKRFNVFADHAEVLVHGDQGTITQAMPNNVYFTGDIQGLKDSRVFIGFLENGDIEGVVETADGFKFTLDWQHNNQFKLNKPNTEKIAHADHRDYNPKDFIQIPESEIIEQRSEYSGHRDNGVDYQLTVAIETDYEFYQIFNDINDEINYIAGLIGYLSSMYYNEINTFVLVGDINIWTTAADPWNATSSGCALFEVGKYWNDNNTAVNRAITHFISGKSLGGGIAWQGVLCNSAFNFNISSYNCSLPYPDNSNYGGDYGVSGGLSGSFNPANPQPLWDIVVTSHEIGHNFNSPHTHCYAGIGGNPNPVDECYNGEAGCFSGTQTLPGPQGQGSGTIMSYCHLRGGGLSNISLTLGKNHGYGIQPERVPNLMRDHVETVANIRPQCIMPAANDLIFMNGFEQ